DALPVLYVVTLSSLFITVGFVLFNGVSGTGKTNISLLLELGVLVVYLVYAYSIINFLNGTVVHMWTSELVYGILLSVLSYLYLKSGRWHEAKI
ncbi:MAG: MATE family efflux transporter, partial [Bacteroidota bacterium]|nr:MATE family efflux transporter [Bacteroidota bacterium]